MNQTDDIYSYKWTIAMPPAQEKLSQIYNKCCNEHFNNIMSGKEQIMISPVPVDFERNPKICVILDFDFKAHSALKLYENAKEIIEKLHFLEHKIEITPNGFHLIFKTRIIGNNEHVVERYREFLNRYLVDKISCANVPIYRAGSFRADPGITMIPCSLDELHSFIRNQDIKAIMSSPERVIPAPKWKAIWVDFICGFEENSINEDNFFKAFDM